MSIDYVSESLKSEIRKRGGVIYMNSKGETVALIGHTTTVLKGRDNK